MCPVVIAICRKPQTASQTPSPFFPKSPITILPTKPWCHLTSKAFLPIFLSRFTLNLILKSIYVDNTTEWHGLNKSRLLKLLSWSTKNTTIQFNNKFYKQLDGVAMGSLIGPLLADIMMNYVIDKAIERTPLDHQPKFFVAMLTIVLLILLIPPLLRYFFVILTVCTVKFSLPRK